MGLVVGALQSQAVTADCMAKDFDGNQILAAVKEINDSRVRARERQRRYRADRPRIDYFPDSSAVATIDLLRTGYAGGDASSIINRIVLEWSSSRGRDPPPSM